VNGIKNETINLKSFISDIFRKFNLGEGHSPLRLNETGRKIFKESKINEVIDKKFDKLLEEIKIKNPQNAYQVQEYSKEVMYDLKNDKELLPYLEDKAYLSGVDVMSILFVGGIYLRDKALDALEYTQTEIDSNDHNHSQ